MSHDKSAAGRSTLLPLLCGIFVGVLGLWLLLSPPAARSIEERRPLTQPPAFTLPSLADGSYTRTLGACLTDQFPLRTHWIRLKCALERLSLQGENNGVLFGRDGYLIPRADPDAAALASLERNLAAVARLETRLAADGVASVFCPLPRSVDVNRAHLPRLLVPLGADAVWEVLRKHAALPYVDTLPSLRAAADRGEQVWYRTDHHWTAEGAYYAYLALSEPLGYTPFLREDFVEQRLPCAFLGTSYARCGLHAAAADHMVLLRYADDQGYRTCIRQNGRVVRRLDGLYDWAALAGEDPYGVFLGGTHALVTVEQGSNDARPTLLVIKDSYAQTLAPFLARHFRLVLIDPRSYRATATQPSLTALIQREQPAAVLVLLGMDTLSGGVDLRTLLCS